MVITMRKPQKPLETYEETKEKALRLLEFRNHSETELKRKLLSAGANEENIEKTLEFLKEYHLLNDEAYADCLARDLKNLKGYGKNRIKNELLARGISKDTADEVLLKLGENDTERLREQIKKRLKDDFDKKNKDKAIRYFIYRGYSFEEIRDCINSIEQEGQTD